MADIQDYLATVAELSIGLAGFAGIVAALVKYNRTELAVVRFRMTNLLASSFAPGFFALITFGLISAELAIGQALRISSGILALYLCVWAVLVYRTKPPGISRKILVAMSAGVVLNVVVQLISIVGLSRIPGTSYLAGLILLLLQGATVFVILVMDALRAERDAGAPESVQSGHGRDRAG